MSFLWIMYYYLIIILFKKLTIDLYIALLK